MRNEDTGTRVHKSTLTEVVYIVYVVVLRGNSINSLDETTVLYRYRTTVPVPVATVQGFGPPQDNRGLTCYISIDHISFIYRYVPSDASTATVTSRDFSQRPLPCPTRNS